MYRLGTDKKKEENIIFNFSSLFVAFKPNFNSVEEISFYFNVAIKDINGHFRKQHQESSINGCQ